MDIESYFDFAEDDYRFFTNAYTLGLRANTSDAIAQNIYEKYMKHIIKINSEPESFEEEKRVQDYQIKN